MVFGNMYQAFLENGQLWFCVACLAVLAYFMIKNNWNNRKGA